MEAAPQSYERANQPLQRMKRIVVLLICLVAALVATLLLSLVWEMRIYGTNYRRLYPAPLVDLMFAGTALVGCILFVNEFSLFLRLPLWIFPITGAVYIGSLVTMTYLFAHDFAVARNHPMTPNNSEQGGTSNGLKPVRWP